MALNCRTEHWCCEIGRPCRGIRIFSFCSHPFLYTQSHKMHTGRGVVWQTTVWAPRLRGNSLLLIEGFPPIMCVVRSKTLAFNQRPNYFQAWNAWPWIHPSFNLKSRNYWPLENRQLHPIGVRISHYAIRGASASNHSLIADKPYSMHAN